MLLYKGFIGQIDYDTASHTLVGEIVNSVDVLEFSGGTAEEIRANFQSCVDDYIKFQVEQVGVTPTPFIGHFTLCLAQDKQKKVIRAARKEAQSVSHWLNHHVDLYLTKLFKE